ncbi:zinc finger protein 217 [Eucyclogobius newberryi]|uniref:zinc finger protein 217 n=1 Tax=Eucyclogobius newberryi TaxID=166745 RepID=UPI003B5C6695
MPTHPLPPFAESPDGLERETLIGDSANVPGRGLSTPPHGTRLARAPTPDQLVPCMFCDQTFSRQDELGPHVLACHPTTFPEPAVLRVEAEFRIPGERNRPKPTAPVDEEEEGHSCIVCGQAWQNGAELENHMRKHKDYFYYCCSVCGRRFREPWFLKTHMKIHTRPGGKGKATPDPDGPATINGVAREPPDAVTTAYKMCMVCGFFFPDRDSLANHCRVHNREAESHGGDGEGWDAPGEGVRKETFVQSLRLRPAPGNAAPRPVRTSKWIAQLDPFNTYQAWQLATKGKIAVGPNHAKDPGQEASTDNEECASDKEEAAGERQAAGKEARPAPPATTVPPPPQRRSLIQKDKSKERPTTCDECQKTFRTYHQLVLHSRIHKRESPTAALEKPEDEDGLEEAPLPEMLASGETGFERAKGRSKECSYCGKSFRSSYYLTVHLRTHTGEKPFKCAYCDYAAAQKTSLKYHLDRRHKDKPYVELPVRPASASSSSSSLPSPSDLKLEPDCESSSSPTKLWLHESKAHHGPAPFGGGLSADAKPAKPLLHGDGEFAKLVSMCADALPAPVNLKTEAREMKDEVYEDAPLNLSLKVSLSISSEPRRASVAIACPQCAFRTIYPEVLIIHRKLTHKERSDNARRHVASRQKRHTGCPPALDGKDVPPLPMIVRSHPRRTKSPTPSPPPKAQEKESPSKMTPAPKLSPPPDRESQKVRPSAEPQDGRFTEVMRKASAGGAKYLLEIPTDRIGIGERSYAVRSGVVWPAESSRMCLSSRFGNLAHMDLGEPSGKRLKYNGAQTRDPDAAEKAGFRGLSAAEMSLVSGRSGLPGPPPSDALGAVKSSSVALGGALDSEWSTMDLLRSCTLNDLASLYHTSPGNPPRAGGRTVLYQHLPTLPNPFPSNALPSHRYSAADKSA